MIKELILSSVHELRPVPNGSGWHTCKCKVCNDYKVRGGFKFEGEGFGYNCFNCGKGITYDPESYSIFSDDVLEVLIAFGVDENSCREIEQHYQREFILNGTVPKKSGTSIVKSRFTTSAIDLPPYFIPLNESTSPWAQVLRAYVTHARQLPLTSHNYMILDYDYPDVPITEIKKWHKRLIIPIYYNGDLVWWQGRAVTGDINPKYLNSDACGASVLFSRMDIFSDPDVDIVFIVEGFFDAIRLNGAACFRNKLTQTQLDFLHTLDKRIVYIPDRYGSGQIGANQMIREGFEVALPDIGDCKDVDEAVKRYGEFYVKMSIMQNIFKGDDARYRLNLYCIRDEK